MGKPDGKDKVIHNLGIIIANLTIEKEIAIAQRDELAEYIANLERVKENAEQEPGAASLERQSTSNTKRIPEK